MTDHIAPMHLFPRDGEFHLLVGNYDGHKIVWLLDDKVILEENIE